MAFCMISPNCDTCSFAAMHNFVVEYGEKGFTKADMRKELGDLFCESEWRMWVSKMRHMISPTYVFSKELGEWYLA